MIRWSWPSMGSMASLAVPGTGTPAARSELGSAVRAAQDWLDSVEAAMSPYRATSDLCRWRRGDAPLVELSPLLGEVVAACADLQERTGGGFHPLDRAGRYDPSGYVKGWAVQGAMRVLVDAGVSDACLGVGGDVAMRGTSDEGRPWRAAISDPSDGRRIVAVLEQPAGGLPFAVATSGAAQRGEHIWAGPAGSGPAGSGPAGSGPAGSGPAGSRPASSRPASSRPAGSDALASVTVVGPDLGRVDAFATAIWARGRSEPLGDAWSWLPVTGCAALALTADGTVHLSKGMAAYVIRPPGPRPGTGAAAPVPART